MDYKLDYIRENEDTTIEAKLLKNPTWRLKEIQNITEGDFLIFTDEPADEPVKVEIEE